MASRLTSRRRVWENQLESDKRHYNIIPTELDPIWKPGLDLLEIDEVKTKRPSMWNVVFYNDDYTPMHFCSICADEGIS